MPPKGRPRQRVTERWIYDGPESGVVQPRNMKGTNGRATVTNGEGGTKVLDIDGIKFEIPHGLAEELNAALCSALRPYAGLSIFERIMEEMDAVMDRLMAGEPAKDGRDPGRAEALCRSLALIRNTYTPDYDEERERAVDRWYARNGLERPEE